MSRIGKLLIQIPEGVTVSLDGQTVSVNGPKGQLATTFLPVVSFKIDEKTVSVARKNDHPSARSAHGLSRQLLANMIHGVSTGFEKKLELKGVGYRAVSESEKKLVLSVGYSHPVTFAAPEHISFKVEKNIITISGIDKQAVGELTAQIRRVRPPEPYKGKGIKYLGERVRRKAGKAAKTGA